MASKITARYISRRLLSSGKILSEEEKATENIYIKIFCLSQEVLLADWPIPWLWSTEQILVSDLISHAYNKGKAMCLVVSRVPLPSYRADLDERHVLSQKEGDGREYELSEYPAPPSASRYCNYSRLVDVDMPNDDGYEVGRKGILEVIAKLEGAAVSQYCALHLLQETLDESLYELARELVRFLMRSGREYEPSGTDSDRLSPKFLGIFLSPSSYKRQSLDKSTSFKETSAHIASVKNILETHASYLMSVKELSKLVAFVKGTQFDLVVEKLTYIAHLGIFSFWSYYLRPFSTIIL